MERLTFQRGFVSGLLPIESLQEQSVITEKNNNSLLNVTHRVKSFKLHKIRHDQKLAISILFCLKKFEFPSENL